MSPPVVVDADPDLEISLADNEEIPGEAHNLDVPFIEDFGGFKVASGSAGEVENRLWGKKEEDIEGSDSSSRLSGDFL